VHLGAVGAALAVVGIAWCLNLFNFMDGINGMAAGEAVIVGAAASVLLLAAGASGVALPAMLLSAAALGFLPWNWPNARIFMGDVGSNLLGFVSGVLAVASENARGLPLLAWAVLAAVFIFDTTITLVRRVRRGERLHHIHRRHAYQRAVQTGYSHGVVSGSVMLLDVVLAAGAGLALAHPPLLLPVLAAAFLLVACVYLWMERVLPMFASPPPPAPQHVPERRKQPTA
jgi:Fuc2NAc and GlcNAc transferase